MMKVVLLNLVALSLAQRLEAEGYDWIKKELGIEDETVEQEA